MFERRAVYLVAMVNFLLIVLLFVPLNVKAGRGCCSWHGGQSYCDTSVGRWVCNDGTYSPSCGCSYVPPKPVCQKATIGNAQTTFKENGCNQDVSFSWSKGLNSSFYSLGISKVRGADPGSKADTEDTSYLFRNVKPGKWFINIKAGQSCGWGDVYTWEIDVPEVKPTLYFNETVVNEDERLLSYSTSCAQKVEIDHGIGELKTLNGSVTIHPIESGLYTLTAYNNGVANSSSLAIQYPFSKEEKAEEASQAANIDSSKENKGGEETGSSSLLLWSIITGSGVIAFRKYLSSKGIG